MKLPVTACLTISLEKNLVGEMDHIECVKLLVVAGAFARSDGHCVMDLDAKHVVQIV